MRKLFSGYYRPSEDDFRHLWQDCVFVFDASSLLNVYAYSKPTRMAFMGLVGRLRERVWLPHQFAMEFQKGRVKVILQQASNYNKVEQSLGKILREQFESKREHPFLGPKPLQAFRALVKELKRSRLAHEDLLRRDPYLDEFSAIFDESRIGPAPADTELKQLHKEAAERFGARIPPGYADQKEKDVPECYGDYIGWRQTLVFAQAKVKPIILITDDGKEDWWMIRGESKRTVGPRPELIAEFTSSCDKPFYMYSSEGFMRYARSYLRERVGSAAIEEVTEQLAARRADTLDIKAVGTATVKATVRDTQSKSDSESLKPSGKVGAGEGSEAAPEHEN